MSRIQFFCSRANRATSVYFFSDAATLVAAPARTPRAAMSTTNRLNVVPTVTVLAVVVARLTAARRGQKLLKRKSDALALRRRQILRRVGDVQREMVAATRDAHFALTRAKYAAGEKITSVILVATDRASARVRVRAENIAGVEVRALDEFHKDVRRRGGADLIGLERGGLELARARVKFSRALSLSIELASLRAAFATIDAAIDATNRRVNALERVVAPRLESTEAYVRGELDELEREEFYRLKMVKAKKKREEERVGAGRRERERRPPGGEEEEDGGRGERF